MSDNHQKTFPKIRVVLLVQDTEGKLAATEQKTLPTVELQGGEAWTDAVERCLSMIGLSQKGSLAQLQGLESGTPEGVSAIFRINKYTGALGAGYKWEAGANLKASKISERAVDKSIDFWVD